MTEPEQASPDASAPSPTSDAPATAATPAGPGPGLRISEDWAATIFGLALLLLVLAGVLTLEWLP